MKTPANGEKVSNVTGRGTNARSCAGLPLLLSVVFLGLAPPVAAQGPSAATRPESAPEPASRAGQPLDLRLGELRSFMAPTDWFTALPSDLDEVIVRGRRKPGEIPDRKQVPQGLGGLFWGARNPTQAWRLLVPDPNVKIPPRDADSPQEPPGAYRSRIGEPGKIF